MRKHYFVHTPSRPSSEILTNDRQDGVHNSRPQASMYHALSPIFDVPELPTLRRMKPLPKRRRTSEATHDDPVPPVPAPYGDAAASEELVAHADTLTAQMALQAYYSPVLGGVQDLFRGALVPPDCTPVDLGGGALALAADFRSAREDEDAPGGDGADHPCQPGNTKKRKVPANTAGDAGAGGPGTDDEPAERGIPTGARLDRDYDLASAAVPASHPLLQKKGRLPRATYAMLQHKELIKSRKRQVAAVLGTLPHGDTLALGQALSSAHPFVRKDAPHVRTRPSRRRGARLARAHKAFRAALPAPPPAAAPAVPEASFSFVCHSATSERMAATKEEVALLHSRFEAELARQAAKAAEAAAQTPAALVGPAANRAKQSRSAEAKPKAAEQPPAGKKERGGKKKKRAAHANASNPHHLRNYVPSRLPHSGGFNGAQTAQSLLSPLPLRFLSADVPPRQRAETERAAGAGPVLTNPADEWICPFCEYALFYGDDLGYQRAVRNRKKILRRRRRARERAAAAASGTALRTAAKDVPAAEEGRAEEGAPAADGVAAGGGGSGKAGRMKEERDRGGPGIAQAALG
ncbi:hypothetical protein WOLCODRAFT_165152 [Wolfiporia cocos MD-104 SS10]|uniref:Uncharacterized protein n=1 Tax=Wolfiporia cocos (strain MD-104) TaxID=742152 RepID=A0A2H3K5W1_WOLCO|nr:hypothetical protein WOLCODRAFT_165152 [Wolfiporia cocos MD-104 SS10]